MSKVTIRPTGTQTAAPGWDSTPNIGANLHTNLGDASDSSWVDVAEQYTRSDFIMADPTLPSSWVLRSIEMFMRANGRTGTTASDGYIGLQVWSQFTGPSGGSVTAQVVPESQIYVKADGTPPRTYSSAPVVPTVAGGAYAVTASVLNGMLMLVTLQSPDPAHVQLYDVWLVLTLAEAPAVDVTAIAGGTLAVSNPTFTWGYTPGVDGGAQTKAELKVFTSAQYSAGGFDPSTSTPTYSATITGSTTSHRVVDALANSTTFRVFVRAAQTINGVDQWSAWNYEQFNTSYTVTTVQTVTVTADSSNYRHQIVVARDTGTPAWVWVEVERSNDGGTTWAPVRGAHETSSADATFVTAWSTSSVTVRDYESSNGVATLYRARAMNTGAGAEVVGPWTNAGSSPSWSTNELLLKDPLHPTRNRVVQLVGEQPELTDNITQTIMRPQGRATPVVITDEYQASVGQLDLECYTFVESDALKTLLDSVAVLLQVPPVAPFDGSSRYIVLGPRTKRHVGPNEWVTWSMSFVETDRFADDVTP